MPATTPNGWPYVLPTDNVADYPVTSQALAAFADPRVPFAYALYTFTMSVGSAASYDRVVNFPAGLFTLSPIVLLSKMNSAAVKWIPNAVSTSTAGTTVRAQTADGSTGGSALSLVIGLLAMQYSASSAVTPGVTFFGAQEVDLSQEEDPAAMRALLARAEADPVAVLLEAMTQ